MFDLSMMNSANATIKNLKKTSSSVPIIASILGRRESNDLFRDNPNISMAFRRIEMEYTQSMAPFDMIYKRLESIIAEVQTRIEYCKSKSMVEEETYFYGTLNQMLANQIRLVEKKADIIDKKHRTLQAERKMLLQDLNKNGGVQTQENIQAGPNPGRALAASQELSSLKPTSLNLPLANNSNTRLPDSVIAEALQLIKNKNQEAENKSRDIEYLEKEIKNRTNELEEIKRVEGEEERKTGAEVKPVDTQSINGEMSIEALQRLKERKELGTSILNTTNGLNMNYKDSKNALEMRLGNTASEEILYIDLDSGRYYTETWMDGKKIDYNGTPLDEMGMLSIDANSGYAETQMGNKRFRIKIGDDSNMNNYFRKAWNSGLYEENKIPKDQLMILTNMLDD